MPQTIAPPLPRKKIMAPNVKEVVRKLERVQVWPNGVKVLQQCKSFLIISFFL